MHPTHSLLNHPQREHLSVLLSQMEDALDKLRVVAQPGTGAERCLTVVDDDLPIALRNGIEPIVTRLRECIARMAIDFHLTPRRISRSRIVAATIMTEMIRIEDSYAEHLNGYGPVAPGLGAALDPALRELHDGWASIKRLLADHR